MTASNETTKPDSSDDAANPVERFVILPLPDGATRMESGPIQFGNDWPGIFMRGYEALYFSQLLENAADAMAGTGDVLGSMQIRRTAKAFASCKL